MVALHRSGYLVTETKPLILVRPPQGLAALNLHELTQYGELVRTFAQREILLRYRQTALGVIWVVLQPLLTAGIASFVFGKVAGFAQGDPAFFLRAFSGQIAWTVFGLSIFKISTCLVGNSAMLSKVFFPRLTLPVASTVAAQVDTLVALGAFLLLMPFFHVMPTLAILTLPLWFAALAVMALGIGMMMAALMVSYRDVQFVLPVWLNSLMVFSPVQWPLAKMAGKLGALGALYLLFNPAAILIEGFRWSLMGGSLGIAAWQVGYAAVSSVVILLGGLLIFRMQERRFADVI
jgi:lipopolysaccharide transport system permease protein